MKKYFLSMLAMAAMLLIVSCSKDDTTDADKNATVSFDITTSELATRAYGDGTKALHLMYAVYDETTLTADRKTPVVTGVSKLEPGDATEFSNLKASVNLSLLSGNEYSILFWAAAEGYDDAYTILWDEKYVVMKKNIPGNVEAYDSFFWYEPKFKVNGSISKPITLARPFAQLNIGTNDKDEAILAGMEVTETKVVVKNVPTILDVTNGNVAGEGDVTYEYGAVPTEDTDNKFHVDGYKYLAINYVLAGEDKIFSDIVLSHKSATKEFTNTYPSIPLQRNHRTNVYGSILTNSADYEVNIEDEFGGNHNEEIKEVATSEDINKILQTSTDTNIQIKLTSDVNINVNARTIVWGGDNTNTISINGNGHKITFIKNDSDWNAINMKNANGRLIINNAVLDTNDNGNGAWNNYTIRTNCVVELNNVDMLRAVICLGNDATLNNVDIQDNNGMYGLYITAAAHNTTLRASTERGHNIDINGLTITTSNDGRGIKIIDQYIDENEQGVVTLNITDAVFTTQKKAAILVTSKAGANITLKDVDISGVAADTFNAVWVDEDYKDYADKVTVSGGTSMVEGTKLEESETDSYYHIKSLADLTLFASQVNNGTTFSGKTVVLDSDIDLANMDWTPIGNSTNNFQGTFDGQSHTISNLKVIKEGKSDIGLFGMTTNGEIKNLTVYNAEIKGRLNVGVVAGTPYTSKYTNINVKGLVKVDGMSYVGAVGGKNAYADWTDVAINVTAGSYVKANSVENGVAYRTYVGGACGFNGEGGHSFQNITSNIDVEGSTCDVGGLFGIAHYGNKFENCSSSGNVKITNATEAGYAEEIGGIAGVWNNGGADVTFTNCSFTGTLTANITEGVDLSDNTIVGKAYSVTGSGKLIIDGVTMIADGVGQDADGNYTIHNANGLVWFGTELNVNNNKFTGKTITIASDINMNDVTYPGGSVASYPSYSFEGTFNGNNKTISNLTINVENDTHGAAALIPTIGSNATIKDITLENVNISSSHYAAGIWGYMTANTGVLSVTNCHINGGSITGNYYNNDNADKIGGIGGIFYKGTVSGCSVKGVTLTGYRDMAGIVGWCDDAGATVEQNNIENVIINVVNDPNYKSYSKRSEYDVNNYAGEATSSNVTNNSGTATINWGSIAE